MNHTWTQRLSLSGLTILLACFLMGQTLSRRELGLVNPLEFGATCTTATLQAAITSIGVGNRTLMLTVTDRVGNACIWAITSNVTVPANIVLWVSHGAVANIDAGVTLTLNRYPRVDNPAWHTGSGSVRITDPYPPDGAILVADHAVSGTGTIADPYQGWATTITWMPGTTYVFRPGWYNYATCPAWGLDDIRLIGVGQVLLNHTGTGDGLCFNAGNAPSTAVVFGLRVENLIVRGNAATTNGILVQGVAHATFDRVAVIGASPTGACLRLNHTVLTLFYNFICSENYADNFSGSAFYSKPDYGIWLDRRNVNENSTAVTFINPIIEGLTGGSNGVGIYLNHSDNVTILNGSSEHNNHGLWTTANANRHTVISMFFEGNTLTNLNIFGALSHFDTITSIGTPAAGQVVVNSGAAFNKFTSGQYTQNFNVTTGAFDNRLDSVRIDGTLTNLGTRTILAHVTHAGNYINTVPVLDGADTAALLLGQNGQGVGIGQTGHAIKKHYTTTIAYGGGTITNGAGAQIASANLSGIPLGSTCSVSLNVDTQGLLLHGYVDVAGHVKAWAANHTGVGVTLAASIVRLTCWEY